MRQALPMVASPLPAEELAGLACEPEVESRLVIEHGTTPWQVKHGPFRESDFTALPSSHWTLLVQDVDKHLPAAAALLEPFAFLPRWRIDDLMISYAADQGSVGPHLDAYDVFLIQTQGTRRWRISTACHEDADLIPGLEIKVLQRFDTEQEWLLHPGDVLYLPPGVAHWGVAEGPCMTCSVGFRSPSQQELAAGWLQDLLDRSSDTRRYRDPPALPAGLGGEIPASSIATVRQLLAELCDWRDTDLADWFGRFITEPKPQLEPAPAEPELALHDLAARLASGAQLVCHPYARLAFNGAHGTARLFADGQSFAIEEIPGWMRRLCNRQSVGAQDVADRDHGLLLELYNQGSLLWLEEADGLLG
jgi:50S ribosomal protein L16 3-hydroxylase